MTPAATRAPRSKTAVILLLAATAVAGAALLTPRRGAPASLVDAVAPDAVSVSARATSSHVLRGTSETHIAITLRAPDLAHRGARPPAALAIVIDRSGSMTGAPLAHAKAAAQRLIDQLEAYDRFAVVTYSTGAEMLAPTRAATPDAKAAARAAIERIAADGGTNISAGLRLGADALDDGDGERVRRVVLISDGQANEGIYDRQGLSDLAADTAARGASITSVGVGLDFDERTMTAIAVAGRGQYYFVEDFGQLATLFDRELEGLGAIVATDAELVVAPAPGVEVLEAYGYRMRADGGTVRVPVADLEAGAVRKVVLRVRVRADGDKVELARVQLGWRTREDRARRTAEARVAVAVSDDAGAVLAHRDRDVVRQVEEVQTARALETAADAYERGDFEGASRVLDVRAAEAARLSLELGDASIQRQAAQATGAAKAGFAAAPEGGGDAGKRALKASRAGAYQLAH